MEEEEDEDVVLNKGTIVDSAKGKYVVIKLLGEGGFGAVYKVHDKKSILMEYAMKVEKKLKNRRHSKLKMEIAILKLALVEGKQSHFTRIIDRGKKESFYFLVMELVGRSLASLKMSRPTQVFSLSTAMGAGIQCLEACQNLHKYGFIHRDLKPANYACGLGDRRRIVYILDFGIARKILNEKGELKPPRKSVRFKGTIRFASLACHRNVEMSAKDDCESWFYLLLDFLSPKGLIWKSIYDRNAVMHLKRDMRTSKREIAFSGIKCRKELIQIMYYLDKLQYQDRVDYNYIYTVLQMVNSDDATKAAGGDLNKPYDWEVEEDATQTVTGEEKPRLSKIIAAKKKRQQMIRKKQKVKDARMRRSRTSAKSSKATTPVSPHQQRHPGDRRLVETGRPTPATPESSTMSTSVASAMSTGRKSEAARRRKKKASASSSSSESESRPSAGCDVIQSINIQNMSF